ncbi:MAG: hypothetical protein GPJ54_16470 [Candidatus Heimdallarchaeota archaeon]|nr:hypothetical protein [Candidatus Heimdallarchaeota archaeon]
MLKEIFVIEDGINIFHYATNDSTNNVDPVLTSGFLSALQSFTSHSRSSQINSYTSETEIVFFKKIQDTNKNLVAIFSSKTDESYAETMLYRIDKVFSKSKIMFEMNVDVSNTREGVKIKKRIDKLLHLSTTQKTQNEVADNLFKLHKVEFLSIYDVQRKKSIFRRSETEIKKSFANEIVELDKAIGNFVKQLNLGEDYNFVILETDNCHISFYKSDSKVTFSKGSARGEDHIKLPLNIHGYIDTDDFLEEFMYLSETTKWRMEQDNSINVIKGDPQIWRDEQICAKLVNQFSTFLMNLFDDLFFKIQIYVSNPKLSQTMIIRQYTAKSNEFTIYQEQMVLE